MVEGELQPRLAEDVLQRPAGAGPQGRGLLHSLWGRGHGQDGRMTIITRYSVNVSLSHLIPVPCLVCRAPTGCSLERGKVTELQSCKVRGRGRGRGGHTGQTE